MGRRRRWSAGRDTLLAAGLAAFALLMYPVLPLLRGEDLPAALVAREVAATLLMTVPLVWRGRVPVVVLAVVVAGSLLVFTSDSEGWGFLGVLVAIYTVAAERPWRISAPAFATLLAAFALVEVVAPSGQGLLAQTAGVAFFIGIPWLIGAAVRQERRRGHERLVSDERQAWEREQRAIADERARIARELHDVVAHHVSSMVVSAGAAERVFEADPEGGRASLAYVADTARETTEAMHRLLGVLAQPDGTSVPSSGPGGPTLRELDRLVERFRQLGCPVDLRVTGDLASLPRDVGLSGYRIVQEALTNTLRHAGAVPVTVEVARSAVSLDIGVHDRGPADGQQPPPADGAGHGLIGMRERVSVFGGHLTAGPAAGGGWSVRASLTLDPRIA